jgi:hypothetical protein
LVIPFPTPVIIPLISKVLPLTLTFKGCARERPALMVFWFAFPPVVVIVAVDATPVLSSVNKLPPLELMV